MPLDLTANEHEATTRQTECRTVPVGPYAVEEALLIISRLFRRTRFLTASFIRAIAPPGTSRSPSREGGDALLEANDAR